MTLTVDELMEELANYPSDAKIEISDGKGNFYSDISTTYDVVENKCNECGQVRNRIQIVRLNYCKITEEPEK
jgi:hypothetical protein